MTHARPQHTQALCVCTWMCPYMDAQCSKGDASKYVCVGAKVADTGKRGHHLHRPSSPKGPMCPLFYKMPCSQTFLEKGTC